MTAGPVDRTVFPKGMIRLKRIRATIGEAKMEVGRPSSEPLGVSPAADSENPVSSPSRSEGTGDRTAEVERETGRLIAIGIGELAIEGAAALFDFVKQAGGRLVESLSRPPDVEVPPTIAPVPVPVPVPAAADELPATPVGIAEIQPPDYDPGGKFRPVIEFRERGP